MTGKSVQNHNLIVPIDRVHKVPQQLLRTIAIGALAIWRIRRSWRNALYESLKQRPGLCIKTIGSTVRPMRVFRATGKPIGYYPPETAVST
jgi:hypothetical protein